MVAHTPGPWRECGSNRGGCICGLVFAEGADVAIADCNLSGDEELREYRPDSDARKANARLIAAAPELLEALKLAESAFWGTCESEGQEQAITKIRAAIAKATGETP